MEIPTRPHGVLGRSDLVLWRREIRYSSRERDGSIGYSFTVHDFPFRSPVRMVIFFTPRSTAMMEPQRLLKVSRIGFRPMEVFSALPSSMTSWRSSSSWTMVDTVAFVRCSIFARSARESGGWLAIASRTRRGSCLVYIPDFRYS